ncbi:GGDEF domain-containing protein [Mycobacterium europaeum]|uniref:GGDEF domain-containing protein n=1 Tax=Mycobacterium europaeum TaxID=761804 RepID=UPI002ADF0E7F|nr:GGDEF domain-containing protein [Mycobacterium europaeum]MEA1162061.1 GGDEF domain-containing protein [Mycobacterium europaeum]
MHWIGVWWRQPDHYEWFSDYLGARGLKPFVRYLMVGILAILAAATLLMLNSPSGPQTPIRRAIAAAFIACLAGMALVWLRRWPGRVQSQVFSIVGTLGIGAMGVIEGDPRSGMLACAAFGGLAGYVAFCHSARLLVFTLGTALGTAAVCAGRIAESGDAAMAAANLLLLSAGILAVPFCGQILVHWLSVDALKSSTDPLTGLRNRRGFYRSASKLSVADQRSPCLSVSMVDLDNFKRVNDTHGHAAGDRILVAVAGNLRRIGDEGTIIARVGGEEFLVAQRIEAAEACRIAEAMRQAIAATPWGVTASVGVSSLRLPTGGEALDRRVIERLVHAADLAMYEAKRAGGNQVRHADLPVPPVR